MKKMVLSALLCLCALLANAQTVELKYFHGKQRCATCMAIEKCTKELLDELYQKEVKDGKVKMQVIDITSEKGKTVAKEYKVTWSSLYIVKDKARKDLTRMAFQYTRKEPETFKKKLKEEIDALLKKK